MKPSMIKSIVPWQAVQEVSIIVIILGFSTFRRWLNNLFSWHNYHNQQHTDFLYVRERNNSGIVEQSKFGHACHEENLKYLFLTFCS